MSGPTLVLLDFQRHVAERYEGRTLTDTCQMPVGFNGDDMDQIETFRAHPEQYRVPELA